jgi:molybdate/tungstate transport system permease protein
LKPAAALLFAAVGIFALVFLVAPFITLPAGTDWSRFGFIHGDLTAALTSVLYSLAAVAIIALFGTPLAYVLARYRFAGSAVVEAFILIPFLTPPLAMGLLLASTYGPYGILGAPLGRIGLTLTNNGGAFLLAQIYGASPYYIVGARAAFEGVPEGYERVSRTLGKSGLVTFVRITLPLARLGLASALATAWVRALGEFGIVLIMAYYPHGIPVQLWVNLQDYGLSSVYPLMWLLFLVGLPLPLALGFLSRGAGVRPRRRA